MAESRHDNESGGPLAKLRELASRHPATEQLLQAGEDYAQAKAEQVMSSAGTKLGEASRRLADTSDNGSLKGLFTAGDKIAEGKSPLRAVAEAGGNAVKKSFSGLLGKRGGGSGGKKVINIVEDIDVGVPVREAYDQWTDFQKFSDFGKGVVSADRSDETTSQWRFKIFWSNRSMKATVTEQIPDERIVWTTEGAKGTIKGAVTFHELTANLTKVLLVIEYYPAGLFEKTGNIWRAQGRRARLDLKHFRRFITMAGQASDDGWRGEIRDGEVVRTPDQVREDEESDETGSDGSDGEYEEEPAEDDEDLPEDGSGAGDESGEESGDEFDEEPEDEPEEEPADRPARRRPARRGPVRPGSRR
ncbi:SRPBCC family protein [Amycolatopsis jiangsuensis]|uniref:Putative membrane protein n=1 Tax=Amycolatopsis jiangsuensis TaxID=1181879 RepID=A0A840IU93_9PSEU|nr:SRPBCC family protein [Amycolatopsis jiangsuensis]MBB4686241.1 putative membrane protein [Amycolatopsis jiangsuensis]